MQLSFTHLTYLFTSFFVIRYTDAFLWLLKVHRFVSLIFVLTNRTNSNLQIHRVSSLDVLTHTQHPLQLQFFFTRALCKLQSL